MKNRITIIVVLVGTVAVIWGIIAIQLGQPQFGGAVGAVPDMPTELAMSTATPPTFVRPTLPSTWTQTPIPPTATSISTEDTTLSAIELYERGVEAYWNQDSEMALVLFTQALALDEYMAEAYAFRGSVHRSHNDLKTAYSDYQMAESLAPDNAIVLAHLARWYSFNADYTRALEYVNRAVNIDSDSLFVNFELARVNWHAYNYDKAIIVFENILQFEAYHPIVLSDYAALLMELGYYDESIEILEDLIKEFPELPQPLFTLGHAYRTVGRYQDALNIYSVIESIDSDNVGGIIERGITFDSYMENRLSAILEYERAISIDPSSGKAYTRLGLAYLNNSNVDQALTTWNRSIEVDPNYYLAYYNRANFLGDNIDILQAENDYLRAIELNPRFHQAYMNLASLYRRQSRYDESILYYDNAIKVFPQFWFAYWNRGITHSGIGDYEKAIADYNVAVSINPYYKQIYNSLGIDYQNLGEYELAIEAYQAAIELDPLYARAYHGLGYSYDLMGNAEKAQENYQKAQDLGYQP